MNDRLLIRPLTDGSFESVRINSEVNTSESLSDLSWQATLLSNLAEQLSEDSSVPVQVVLPDELLIGSRALPVLILVRGGWKWLKVVKSALGGVKLHWTIGAAIDQTRSLFPVPFLINPNAPGARVIILLAIFAVLGFGFLGFVSSKGRALENGHVELASYIEELRRDVLEAHKTIEPLTTPLGPLDKVQALRGWASWLTANVLYVGAESGTIVRYSSAWGPPLDLADMQLPTYLEWQIKLKNVSASGLYQLTQRLDEIGLKPEEIQLEEIPELQTTSLDNRPVIIRGRFPISENGTLDK